MVSAATFWNLVLYLLQQKMGKKCVGPRWRTSKDEIFQSNKPLEEQTIIIIIIVWERKKQAQSLMETKIHRVIGDFEKECHLNRDALEKSYNFLFQPWLSFSHQVFTKLTISNERRQISCMTNYSILEFTKFTIIFRCYLGF